MQNSDPDEFLKHHRLHGFRNDDVNSINSYGYIFYIAFSNHSNHRSLGLSSRDQLERQWNNDTVVRKSISVSRAEKHEYDEKANT